MPSTETRIMSLSAMTFGRKSMCMHNIFIHALDHVWHLVCELVMYSTWEVAFRDVRVINNNGNWHWIVCMSCSCFLSTHFY